MNFTYFVLTSDYLSLDLFPNLYHDLLYQNTAVQLYENQVTYNQLIFSYFENESGTFQDS